MKEKAKLFQVTTENANNRTTLLLDEILVPICLVASSRYLRFCKLLIDHIFTPPSHKLAPLKLLTP